ncbi:MAG: FAD-binding oxidoreductase [Pseudomonadota bacterium]
MSVSSAESRRLAVWQNATVTKIEPRTERVTSFFLKPDRPLAYQAGQHVAVRLTAADGYRAQRNYSIATAPEHGGEIELAVERLDNGEVSGFFHEIAMAGDTIEIKAPLGGHFIWKVEDGGPLVLIGGGSGVVPLVSMLRHRVARRDKTPVALLVSSRTWDEVIYRDELIALHDRKDGFELAIAVTRDKAQRAGDYERRIDDAMIAAVLAKLPSAPAQAFVCGSNPFVEMAAHGLMDNGLSPKIIRTERYGV